MMLKALLLGLATAFAVFLASPATAEGGCPPGMVPYLANGSLQSCGPLPSGPAQESASWHTRYGAIAFEPVTGVTMGVRMRPSADDAIALVQEKCAKKTGRQCTSLGSYSNGCIVAMRPKNLGVQPLVEYGGTVGQAKSRLVRFCEDKRFDCEVVYSSCSNAAWF